MFIDIGASSREEAMEWGVLPGDQIVPYFEFTVMNNEKHLLAKAWDNRIGCAIAIDVLKNLKNSDHPNEVYGVGTVQEEVGLRGAKTAAHTISLISRSAWMSELPEIHREFLKRGAKQNRRRAANYSV